MLLNSASAVMIGDRAASAVYLGGTKVWGSVAPWTPAALFAGGEQGGWYDPSDLATMFQDSAGTVPVTAAGQSVGRILDKSGNGNHATQANASNKPILQSIGGKLALVFDGVDDFLSTGSIDFTGTDKMTVVTGVRKLSDAVSIPIELSVSVDAGNNGAFYVVSKQNGVTLNQGYEAMLRGNSMAYIGLTTFASPVTTVMAYSFDIAGASALSEISARINGASLAPTTSGGSAGTGNFGNYPLYICRRGGTSFPFKGNIYQLVVRGALTADLAPIEAFTADKTGVTL